MLPSPWSANVCSDPAGAHVVHLYRRPRSLQGAVVAWIHPILARGGGAILACTPQHAQLIRAGLAEQGLDPAALEAAGRLQVADAEGALAAFLRDGMPDREAFRRIVRRRIVLVRAATGAPQGEIRAWGEMVDVLRMRGNAPAAAALESLWGEIIDEEGLHLLCSYQVGTLGSTEEARLWREVATSHEVIQYEAPTAPAVGHHPVPPALLAELGGTLHG